MVLTDKQTGYPSVDKPWLRYYSQEAVQKRLMPGTIYHHLYENNKEHLDDVALIYFEKKISFRDLFKKIEQCRKSLCALGIEKGDIVTIQTLAIPQTVILLYALSKIGAVANLIYASNGAREVNDILKSTESKAYFVIDSIYEQFQHVSKDTYVKSVVLLSVDSEMDLLTKIMYRISKKKKHKKINNDVYTWNDFMNLYCPKVQDDIDEYDIPVAMTYTGGTTGTSKAVVLTNRSINELVFQYEKANMGFVRQDIFMDSLPPFIAFGLTVSLHLPLCMGIKTVLIPNPAPQNQGKMFLKYKPNYYVAGSAQIEAIINYPKAQKTDFSFLKILATGGDALPGSVEKHINDFLREHNCKTSVFQGYGMSELAATVCTGSATVQRFGTVGIPLPNTIVKIIDTDTGKELSYGNQGEVCIYAPSVMAGYYKNPEETKKILHEHSDGLIWVHTGDIGVMDADGFLSIVGRIKRIITVVVDSLYYKVYPKLLEEQFETNVKVQAAAVVGSGGLQDTQKIVAFIVPAKNSNIKELECELRNFALDNFKSYERPQIYQFISELPRTKIGKVDYRALEREAENSVNIKDIYLTSGRKSNDFDRKTDRISVGR